MKTIQQEYIVKLDLKEMLLILWLNILYLVPRVILMGVLYVATMALVEGRELGQENCPKGRCVAGKVLQAPSGGTLVTTDEFGRIQHNKPKFKRAGKCWMQTDEFGRIQYNKMKLCEN